MPNSTCSRTSRADDPARDAAIDWLMRRINYERTAFVPYCSRQLKLDRMRQLLTRLGQPDAGMKIVHVAGTKGKGSTSAMIAAMLTAAGYRTGVFSSPHLERIEERFAVDGVPCSADELVALVNRVIPIVRAMDEEAGEPASAGDEATSDAGPTYFEITTAIALLHFVERHVDAAVLEVGLGGRLDSTNVCLPVVSVITSISFDHMRQLGNTLASIAREKAGIIKPGVPVVCGVIDPEPQAVIAQIAREHGCRLIQLGRDFDFQYQRAGASRVPAKKDKEKGRQGDTEIQRYHSPCLLVSLSPCLEKSRLNTPFLARNINCHTPGLPCPAAIRQPMPPSHSPRSPRFATKAGAFRHDAISLGLSRAALPGRVEVLCRRPHDRDRHGP